MTDSLFSKASRGQIDQILAHAESYLNAQLTSALAADQRALVYAGFLAAGVVALVGGGTTLLIDVKSPFLGYTAFAMALGLTISMALAVYAARPTGFEFVGNKPDQWVADVAIGKPLIESLREQAVHYDAMIGSNADLLRDNCRWLTRAQWLSVATLVFGGSAIVSRFVVRDLALSFWC